MIFFGYGSDFSNCFGSCINFFSQYVLIYLTETIFSGTGSDFEEVSVPVPDANTDPDPDQIFSKVF